MDFSFIEKFLSNEDIHRKLYMCPEYIEVYKALEYRYAPIAAKITDFNTILTTAKATAYDYNIMAQAALKCDIGQVHGEIEMFACCEMYEILRLIYSKVIEAVVNYYMQIPKLVEEYSKNDDYFQYDFRQGKITITSVFTRMTTCALLSIHGPIWTMEGQVEDKHKLLGKVVSKALDLTEKGKNTKTNTPAKTVSGWPFTGNILPAVSKGLANFNFTDKTLQKSRLLSVDNYEGLTFRDSISVQIIKDAVDTQLYLNSIHKFGRNKQIIQPSKVVEEIMKYY